MKRHHPVSSAAMSLPYLHEPTRRQQQQIPRLPCPKYTSQTSTNNSISTATQRWLSVVQRDAKAITFVYAVLTTGIYCRASCPGRLARRANVTFYDDWRQAEEAGFRACKRCKPQQLVAQSSKTPSTTSTTSTLGPEDTGADGHVTELAVADPQVQMIQKACRSIQDAIFNGDAKPRLQDLAHEARFTAHHFHRVFKKVMGVTPGRYAAVLRERTQRLSSSASASSASSSGFNPVAGVTTSVTAPPPTTTTMTTPPEDMDELDFAEFVVDENPLADSGLADLFVVENTTGWWNDFDWMIAAEKEYLAGCNGRASENDSPQRSGAGL